MSSRYASHRPDTPANANKMPSSFAVSDHQCRRALALRAMQAILAARGLGLSKRGMGVVRRRAQGGWLPTRSAVARGSDSFGGMDPRLARARPSAERPYAVGDSEFRSDLERIRFAQSYSRLAEVTQVVTAGATSGVVHNRLTHTIKVTAVARAIAVRLLRSEDRDLLRDLGGLDHVVVQAAANAHDLGHPPFGHLGERVLDRLARERFGLADGFEGNAQTFRILTELEVHGPGDEGLNLTAAVRAAVLKYPWACFHYPDPHPTHWPIPPRGAGHSRGHGAAKFSAYIIDLPEMLDALSAFPDLPPGRQTLECSVMDLADDIAYSLHDLE